ncbi:hypothetical protein HG536_0D04250 [Torulaspora globosa]|uniref:Uncharacterized protein n=1 Tax=Torulaspora globosa TaxID=48254 RepID=A0A7G3ZHB7_9SACH|nr:uncharacterized protein HG536_0D04250 [Torulaspora globosa]QLL32903.1 hypothetical protein HG536_0D04250 [Torulaspora globosa]
MAVYPDELVHLLQQDIAYNKGKINLHNLWDIADNYVDLKDNKIKEFVFSCLVSCPHVLLYCGDDVIELPYSAIVSKETDFSIAITEDKLWTILTGYTKKESNIGGHAFELLLEIARSKDHGINTKDLAVATGQDPRSITGRVKKLSHLVSAVQMLYKGHVVKLLKLRKFAKSGSAVKQYINMRDHLKDIVQVVKKSKNCVRQIIDLKREFQFDQDKRLSKSFIAAISWLDENGYLKKVLVVSPTNPSVRIRCVQYLRDYLPEEKSVNDFENEIDSSDDEPAADEKGGLDEEDAYENLDTVNATSLLQEQNLIVEEQTVPPLSNILVNRFYPMQNQAYSLADESGLAGISTMQMVSRLTGKDYKRAFTKVSEYYVENAGSKGKRTKYCSLVKAYDFEGKKKFYRFFTEANFLKLMDVQQINGEKSFQQIASARKSIASMNSEHFVPLNNTLRFLRDGDQERFFWNGELKVAANPNAPIRGRKRKQQELIGNETIEDRPKSEAKIAKSDRLSDGLQEINDYNGSMTTDRRLEKAHENTKVISHGGFSAKSLRSLWRQRAIIEVVRRAGGVTYLREQFFEDVSHFMGSQTMIDKKTIRGDVTLMIKCDKLRDRIEPNSGRRIIFLPGVESEVISNYVLKEKDNKKAVFKDVIHDADLYFFDQTEKNKFHRGIKSARRVRDFQNSSKAQKKSSAADKTIKMRPRAENEPEIAKRSMDTQEKTAKKSKGKASHGKLDTLSSSGLYHIGKKNGAKALVMAVVISKSIKNEILWDKITALFPHNSVDNLKKQWTARRVKMGHNGWRAHVDKWHKILLDAIKNEEASLEDAETLDLLKLVRLWMASDNHRNKRFVSLYRDYAENRRCFTFVKENSRRQSKMGVAMSSMVQRETFLLKKVYSLDVAEESPTKESDSEDEARAIIQSVLYDSPTLAKEQLSALRTVSKETLDKVIMDLAKEKQVYFVGSKLEATGLLQEYLGIEGNFINMERSEKYRRKMSEMFDARCGILISGEVPDFASWVIIGLIAEKQVELNALMNTKDATPFSYTTRRFGVSALTPPLILSPTSKYESYKESSHIPIPIGAGNGRLWINSVGSIRDSVWKALVTMVLKRIVFNPGIDPKQLIFSCNGILSLREMSEICDWLCRKELIYEMPCAGYGASSGWYRLFT